MLEHLLRRARDHRQHQDRERERAGDGALPVADDEHPEDEDADDDRRDPFITSSTTRSERRRCPGGELGHVDRDEHPNGTAISVAIADDQALPMIASAIPPGSPKSGRALP